MQSAPRKIVLYVLLTGAISISCYGGPTIVQESVNCSGSHSPDGLPVAVRIGYVIEPRRTLETGPEGRMQLDYGAGLVRAGANSSLRVNNAGEVELKDGAFLFHQLQSKEPLKVSAGSRIVDLFGDAGFVRAEKNGKNSTVAIGGLAGKVQVSVAGKSYKLGPSDLLVITDSGSVVREQFDLTKTMKTSRLVNGFTSPLPQSHGLASAEAQFSALHRRGFIRSSDVRGDLGGERSRGENQLLADNRHDSGRGGPPQPSSLVRPTHYPEPPAGAIGEPRSPPLPPPPVQPGTGGFHGVVNGRPNRDPTPMPPGVQPPAIPPATPAAGGIDHGTR